MTAICVNLEICCIFLAMLAVDLAHASENELIEPYSSAVQACVELGGPEGTSKNLGIDDDLWYYTNVARLDASKKLWSRTGVAFLRAQLQETTDRVRRLCIAQLVREAERRRLDR